jgi:hypothetical protein
MSSQRRPVIPLAVATVAGCGLGTTFLQVAQTTPSWEVQPGCSLRGSSSDVRPVSTSSSNSLVCTLATSATVAIVTGFRLSSLKALPAGAAAAAAAAAAIKGATTTTAAVAAAAGTGSLTKGGGVASVDQVSEDFAPSLQIGVTAPLGFFDPAGFCKKGDENGFRNLRSAEIKHGRVAMMAAVGAVVQHYVKLPGFDGVPSGLAASITAPANFAFILMFILAGILELGPWTEKSEREPGNFGDPLGLNQYTDDMRNRELNNGRFAMIAALGILAGEIFSGKDAVSQLGL